MAFVLNGGSGEDTELVRREERSYASINEDTFLTI